MPCAFTALKAADHGNRITFKEKKGSNNLFAGEALQSLQFHISELRTVNTNVLILARTWLIFSVVRLGQGQGPDVILYHHMSLLEVVKRDSLPGKRGSFWLSKHGTGPEPEEVAGDGVAGVGSWALQ